MERDTERRIEQIIRDLERIIDRIEKIERVLRRLPPSKAISAIGELNMKTVPVGGPATFTFKEFDGPNGTGNIVKRSGPIKFSSDNTAAVTVDDSQQVENPDGSTSVPLVAVGPGVANVVGVDPASQNKVTAGDTETVTAAVAISATGVIS